MSAEPEGVTGVVKLLCEAGARVDTPDVNFGNTALHWAAFGGLPLTLEPMLMATGFEAALAMKNKEGQTPYQIAYERANPTQMGKYPFKSCSALAKTLKAAETAAEKAAKKAAAK